MAVIQDVAPQRPTNTRPDTNKKKRSANRRTWYVVIAALILAACVGLGFAWFTTHRTKSVDTNVNLNDVNVVKARVGRLYLLPADEQPALATVTNEAKLSSSFSGRVKDGDKILIYQTNRKAIAYRPSIDKIVDVEPVSIDAPPAQASKSSN